MKVPQLKFNQKSTAESEVKDIDLTGKVVLITGANSGLGQESMRVLAARGAHIIAAARTIKKARDACANVPSKTTPLRVS